MGARTGSIRSKHLAVYLITLVMMMAVIGCGGGADQTSGSTIKPDPEAAKRQQDMTNFYSKNPLPKPKK